MIEKLHYITHDVPGKSHAELAGEACAAGARWIQLRVKSKPCAEWKEIALQTQAVCKKYGAKLIINDSMTLARDIGADGVHLGLSDLSTAEARKILGHGFIIGGTANTFADIVMHAHAGVNYVGVGPFRFTATKAKLSPILGLEGYRSLLQKCREANIHIPVIAIGGITCADIPSLLETGVYGAAVSSVITGAGDKSSVIKDFHHALKIEE
jgi:thiamine-phosphate pyrophosphorylase